MEVETVTEEYRHGEPNLQEWASKLSNVPASCMRTTSKTIFTQYLNPLEVTPLSSGLMADWRGCAERMDYSGVDVNFFASKKEAPAQSLIDDWSLKSGSNVGQLIGILLQLGKFDILEDENFQNAINSDIERHNRKEPLKRNADDPLNDLPSPPSDSDWRPEDAKDAASCFGDDHYDAYVAYAAGDEGPVVELLERLEGGDNMLRLCIDPRDLLPTGSTSLVLAHLIVKQCKRVIMILTPRFFKSAQCHFVLQIAASFTPGMSARRCILIRYEPCGDMPLEISHLGVIDRHPSSSSFGAVAEKWFWDKLFKSISSDIKFNLEPPEDNKLKEAKLLVEHFPDKVHVQLLQGSTASTPPHQASQSASTQVAGKIMVQECGNNSTAANSDNTPGTEDTELCMDYTGDSSIHGVDCEINTVGNGSENGAINSKVSAESEVTSTTREKGKMKSSKVSKELKKLKDKINFQRGSKEK